MSACPHHVAPWTACAICRHLPEAPPAPLEERLTALLDNLERAAVDTRNAPIYLNQEEASAWCSGVSATVDRIRKEVEGG